MKIVPSKQSSVQLPFGRDVFLFLGKRAKAVIPQERLPMIPHEVVDALTPPAGVSVAAALKHQGPAGAASTDANSDAVK